jgi:secreted PhoX family phosphatase
MRSGQLVEDYLTLTGTAANCAGGATPWGSWLTCEESMRRPPDEAQRYHGFVFEVPASSTGVIAPVPLIAMGRFTHEAVAIDPATGIAYMTEDSPTGLFYRFLPDTPGEFHRGGRLQALVIREWPAANTNNWPRDWGGPGLGAIETGTSFSVDWIDMDDVESPEGDLEDRGHAAGAAQFFRGEGMDYGLRPDGNGGDIYFNCTQGGRQRAGQVWRYSPSGSEGRSTESDAPGTLTLIYESPGADTLDMCDNLAVAPWGDLILCEDGRGDQYLRGLTPSGAIYDLARNAHPDRSEFCGACFSPDGRIMFVNIQEPGITLAITGPWASLAGRVG